MTHVVAAFGVKKHDTRIGRQLCFRNRHLFTLLENLVVFSRNKKCGYFDVLDISASVERGVELNVVIVLLKPCVRGCVDLP